MTAVAASNVTHITGGIQAVQTFKTPDGKFFATEYEARQHMARGQFDAVAQAFIDASFNQEGRGDKALATRAKNIVCDFLAWQEGQK